MVGAWSRAAAFGAVLCIAACATAPQSSSVANRSGDAYADRIFRGGHVQATREHRIHASAQAVDARTLAAFEGIAGARLAYNLYDPVHARTLAGACERFVEIESGETLYDISVYCDVPLYMLMDYNPHVPDARLVRVGDVIEVPYLATPRRMGMPGGGLSPHAVGYIVQPGDSLNAIAARHLISASAVEAANPGVNWRALPVGARIQIPATGGVVTAAPTYSGPTTATVPSYAGAAGGITGAADYADYDEITKVMPYRQKPVRYVRGRTDLGAGVLSIDKSVVKPGGTVWVSAEGLPPNSTVTILGGPNRNDLRPVAEARTGPDGTLNAPVRVRRSANAGGVVFSARMPDGSGVLHSPRVTVLTVADAVSSAMTDSEE